MSVKTKSHKYLSQKEKIKYRDRILSELFKSKVLDAKIDFILYRHHVKRYQQIHDDFIQYCFLELSRKDPSEIIDVFERNKLIGLAVRIIVLRGVSLATPQDNRVKSNWKNMLMFQSTTSGQNLHIEDMDEDSEYSHNPVSINETNEYQEAYNDALLMLTPKEQIELEDYYMLSEKKNRSNKHFQLLESYSPLITKFKNLILECKSMNN